MYSVYVKKIQEDLDMQYYVQKVLLVMNFAILLGDDIVVNKNGKTDNPTAGRSLWRIRWKRCWCSKVADSQVHKYGIIDPKENLTERCASVKAL